MAGEIVLGYEQLKTQMFTPDKPGWYVTTEIPAPGVAPTLHFNQLLEGDLPFEGFYGPCSLLGPHESRTALKDELAAMASENLPFLQAACMVKEFRVADYELIGSDGRRVVPVFDWCRLWEMRQSFFTRALGAFHLPDGDPRKIAVLNDPFLVRINDGTYTRLRNELMEAMQERASPLWYD